MCKLFCKIVLDSMVKKNIIFTEMCAKLNLTEHIFLNKILNPNLLTIDEANILISILDLKPNDFFYSEC